MNTIDDGLCFVCGKDNKSGLRLSFRTENGISVSEFVLQKHFQGYKNIIHGGILCAILDEAMIHAATAEGLNPVTAEITVRFKQPLYADRDAIVEAELTRNETRIVEAHSRITEKATGIIIAEATAKMIPLKRYP
jgi:uncharacterized protein (TIGR00369 family)